MKDKLSHPVRLAHRGFARSSWSANCPGTLAAIFVSGLMGLLTTLCVSAATPAEEHLQRIHAEIAMLRTSVNRGDRAATEKIGMGIESELAALHDEILALPPLRLAVGPETVILKYLGDRVSGRQLAGVLVTHPGIAQDLASLRARVVAQRRYRLDEAREVGVRYYPPGELFVAEDIGSGKKEAALDFLALIETEPRFGYMLSTAIDIETAWRKADRVKLAVRPEIVRRLGWTSGMIQVGYLDTGVVSANAAGSRTYSDLLREVQSQLEYILNIKPEGPPLFAVLRSGLVFDDEFGFEAWGGRWREFAGTIFFLRYDPARDAFLVRLERISASTSSVGD